MRRQGWVQCYMLTMNPNKTDSGVVGLRPKVRALGMDEAAYGENRGWKGSMHRNP